MTRTQPRTWQYHPDVILRSNQAVRQAILTGTPVTKLLAGDPEALECAMSNLRILGRDDLMGLADT